MHAGRVNQLGYLGIEASDVAAWKAFAGGVLGLQSNGGDADGSHFLKMDDNHHRLTLHPGTRDDIAYAGWQVTDEVALQALASRLEAQGWEVHRGTTAELAARRVTQLISARDPNGVVNEVYCGPQVELAHSFRSPRAIGAFEAGAFGFGHIVLAVDDFERSLHFYRDGLGLRVSDYIELDMGVAGATTVAFLHSGPRHHSIAIAQFSAPKRLHHFMLQLRDMNDVGTTYDLCQDRGIPIASSLGRHTNDLMTSFYMATPSGFQVEYGHGGLEIDEESWTVQRYTEASLWGHRSPTVPEHPQGN